MSEIPVTKIIKIDNPSEFKFHAARWNGENQPLDVYVRDKKEWLGWNTWRNNKDEFSRKYIFSLIDFYPENSTWLFGGIYEVVKRNNIPDSHSYEIKELRDTIEHLHIKKSNNGQYGLGESAGLNGYRNLYGGSQHQQPSHKYVLTKGKQKNSLLTGTYVNPHARYGYESDFMPTQYGRRERGERRTH